jgi:hypothetical protein
VFWFLVGVHLCSAVALAFADVGAVATAILLLGVAASFARNWIIHWRQSAPRAIRSLVWQADGRWWLIDNRGETVGRLAHYYLGAHLVILNFSGHPAVLILSAGEASTMIRRLRVRLRHGRARDMHPATGSASGFRSTPETR